MRLANRRQALCSWSVRSADGDVAQFQAHTRIAILGLGLYSLSILRMSFRHCFSCCAIVAVVIDIPFNGLSLLAVGGGPHCMLLRHGF